MYYMIYFFNLILISLLLFLIRKEQRRNTRYIVDTNIFIAQRDRQMRDYDQKWLFKSLYSIDKKVLLPETQAEVKPKGKAVILSPSKHWRAETRGEIDDFHG